jgi:hypothetical protein
VVQAEQRTAELHDRMRELEDTLARRGGNVSGEDREAGTGGEAAGSTTDGS